MTGRQRPRIEMRKCPSSSTIRGFLRLSANYLSSRALQRRAMPSGVGNGVMAGSKRPRNLVRACVSTCAIFASSLGSVRAADLTTSQPAPTPDAPNPFTGWYVKVGAMGVLDRSSSNLYSQSISGMIVPGIGTVPVGVGPQFQIPGLGASYSNFAGVAYSGRLFLHS